MSSMVQVNRVYLKILVINRPQFLVDSNGHKSNIILMQCQGRSHYSMFLFCELDEMS